ncbi:MAG: hypothetical protein NC543_07745 [bacterium]|nr:hypothetical protein [bacterium]MCM1375334.1 hypothetical protein [Muribaculum sp.]
MKAIFIDTNSVNEDGSFYIDELLVKNMGLIAGERVIAYQDADSWEAQIVLCKDRWGAVLNTESREISPDRQEGHAEGFWRGYYVQSRRLISVLE